MVAAPLTAEATLPQSTRGETAIASTVRTIWVTGPASSAAVAAVPGSAAIASSATDSRNGPPSTGIQRACAASTGSARPAAAAPRAGDSSRAHSPSCAIEAATRNSTAAAGHPAATASRSRTSPIRAASAPGELVSSPSGCHGGRTGEPGR
jgi:hypothetical protein